MNFNSQVKGKDILYAVPAYKTLALLLIDTTEEVVTEIAKDLCALFHRESVIVTSSPCSVYFVKEDLWDKD